MKNRDIKNLPASITAKLKNFANENKQNFNLVCLRYYQERFLYRLSISKYNNNFILKGGLILLFLDVDHNRPTKDIDFLGLNLKDNDQNKIKEVFSKVCNIKVNDGILFNLESIVTQKIIEGASYEGIRLKIDVYLGSMITKMTFDIGFENILLRINGDDNNKKQKKKEFPKILEINETPKIYIYPFEAVVAEKLEAIVKLNFHTSRMKDFFDIYFMAQQHAFEENYLVETIKHTFDSRSTNLENLKIIFSKEYKDDKNLNKQWKIFLTRNEINLNLRFDEIIYYIELFLGKILIPKENLIGSKIKINWDSKKWKWI